MFARFPRKSHTPPYTGAFTLTEILVVIAIIVLLAALLFPAAKSVVEKGQSAKCMGNLKDLGVDIQNYVADKGYYPTNKSGNPTWVTLLNWSGATTYPKTWMCPSRAIKIPSPPPEFTPAYTANYTVFNPNCVRPAAIRRPSQVIALIDGSQRSPSGWAGIYIDVFGSSLPNAANADTPILGPPVTAPDQDILSGLAGAIRYRHQGKANALFLDGHVGSFTKGAILQRNIATNY